MKLVHAAAVALFGSTIFACAPAHREHVAAPVPQAVSTTRVNAASWEEEALPKIGKAQLSEAPGDDEALEADKSVERMRRHADSKRSGFGSWK